MGSFRRNLRQLLDYQGMTVKELGVKSGVSKATLDTYLGVRESIPPADVAVKLARALSTSVEWLVTAEMEAEETDEHDEQQSEEETLLDLSRHISPRERGALLCLARYYGR